MSVNRTPTFTFNRKLLGACALTRVEVPVGAIMYSTEVPVFDTILVDGRTAIGATNTMMTAVYDESPAAGTNPTLNDEHRMPLNHIALQVTSDILTELTCSTGPETVRIELRPGYVDWFFDEVRIIEKSIDYTDDKNEMHYPDYGELISNSINEVSHLVELWDELEKRIFPAAFGVS